MTSPPTPFSPERYFPAGMPEPDPDDPLHKPFWDACKQGKLVVQRCKRCDTQQHTAEVICHHCLSFDLGWQTLSGRGHVWSHVNVVHPVHPALSERVPFNVVVVQLDDAPDVRMLGNMIDVAYEEIAIGMPVEVVFEQTGEDLVMPRWRRAD